MKWNEMMTVEKNEHFLSCAFPLELGPADDPSFVRLVGRPSFHGASNSSEPFGTSIIKLAPNTAR